MPSAMSWNYKRHATRGRMFHPMSAIPPAVVTQRPIAPYHGQVVYRLSDTKYPIATNAVAISIMPPLYTAKPQMDLA